MSDEDFVTLGDKKVETSNFDRYKGRKGVIDRVAIISAKLIRGYSYYYEPKKTMFRAPLDPETLAFVKKTLGEPAQYFGLTLFHYHTDEEGNLISEEKLSGKIKTWKISETRYEELSALHKNWPLLDSGFGNPQSDLQIKCTEEQFQRMNFTPMPSAHWKQKEAWYKALKEKERKAQDKLQLALGRKMEDADIMALLGGTVGVATGSVENAGDIDLSDVLDE